VALRWQRPALAPWLAAFALATAYALLAGFETSTRRALLMLLVPLACLLWRRAALPWAVWLGAMAVVLLVQPLAALDGGFWLSFAAVAVLLATFVPRRPRPARWASLWLAQGAVSLAMLPLGAALFGLAAPAGLLLNLLAIPWASGVTLPLTLSGMALSGLWPELAEAVLDMAARSAHWAGLVINWSASQPWLDGVTLPRPAVAALLLSALGVGLLLLPRGLPLRWLGTICLLPLLWPRTPVPAHGEVWMTLLDVGQGQAALLRTRHHAMVYDSGPGLPGAWNLVQPVLLPNLLAMGVRSPDLLLVSHGDLDHAGGLGELQSQFPQLPLYANLSRPRPGVLPCDEQLGWTWDEVDFQVLHPSGFLPYRGNDSSCVLSVTTPAGSLLLPGDISRAVERRLARLASRGHEVIVVPHHGSRSSSSADWLAWTRPQQALVSAGWGNRFGFPHAEVSQRHQQQGSALLGTAECGALRIRLGADGSLQTESARRLRKGIWRWPAASNCP
jgi:competence protein ComEC